MGSNTVLAENLPFDVKYLQNKYWRPKQEDALRGGCWAEQENLWLEAEQHVIYAGVGVLWDSCDCGGEYGCQHPNYWYAITFNEHPHVKVREEEDRLLFETGDAFISLDYTKMTLADFETCCKLLGIELKRRPGK